MVKKQKNKSYKFPEKKLIYYTDEEYIDIKFQTSVHTADVGVEGLFLLK
eukprot:gene9250-1337_t